MRIGVRELPESRVIGNFKPRSMKFLKTPFAGNDVSLLPLCQLCIINEHSSLQRLISKLPSLRNNHSMLPPMLPFRGFPFD